MAYACGGSSLRCGGWCRDSRHCYLNISSIIEHVTTDQKVSGSNPLGRAIGKMSRTTQIAVITIAFMLPFPLYAAGCEVGATVLATSGGSINVAQSNGRFMKFDIGPFILQVAAVVICWRLYVNLYRSFRCL